MTMLRSLSLRWRLVLAFFLVSALPVLGASYLVAEAISSSFQRNIDRWLEEGVRFLAGEVDEGLDEADRAAAIIAAALSSSQPADMGSSAVLGTTAELLSSVGYDAIRIYSAEGKIEFSTGIIDVGLEGRNSPRRSITKVYKNNAPALAIAAIRSVEVAGQTHFVYVANLIDDRFFSSAHAMHSFEIGTYRVDTQAAELLHGDARVPAKILQQLLKAPRTVIVEQPPGEQATTGFTGLLDDKDNLVGVLTVRLAGSARDFESLSTWQLFAALAALAGLLSTAVALVLSRRVTNPIRSLTVGVRAVSAGEYHVKVAEEGGPELEELARGFNTMTQQLDRLHRMEDEMRRRQQFAALGEAAAVIAHEIRNPLGIIKTSSEVVRQRSSLRWSEDQMIGFVLDEVSRIDRLVRELLDYVRPHELELAPLNLRELVDRAVCQFQPEFERRKVTCAVTGASAGLVIQGDRDRLYQVLLNLILNALDAMPAGGRLSITCGTSRDQVTLDLEDTGVGFAAAVEDRIFDPFFTTKAKGTGLGLAKVRSIITNHGGTVAGGNRAEGGAVFHLSLPLHRAEVGDATAYSDHR